MTPQGWTQWRGDAVVVAQDNIDTDQIYPGRFLSVIRRSEMAPAFFADWRFDSEGRTRTEAPFKLGQSVFVAGKNFGCGSSREHAVWVMRDFGFRVVLARSFSPIFKQNAIANGIAPIEIDDSVYQLLKNAGTGVEVSVDLACGQGHVVMPDSQVAQSFTFAMDAFDIHCLRSGLDTLGHLLSMSEKTREHTVRKDPNHSLKTYFSSGDMP